MLPIMTNAMCVRNPNWYWCLKLSFVLLPLPLMTPWINLFETNNGQGIKMCIANLGKVLEAINDLCSDFALGCILLCMGI